MADYSFYTDVYQGSLIPTSVYGGYAAKARAVLDRLCRICRVEGGAESKAMAVCAMAEALYRHSRNQTGVASATVGETSVRYESGRERNRTLLEELYQQAGIYLDIYRGKE